MKPKKGWGVASLITSIIGLIGSFMPYFAIIASIFAIVAYYKQSQIKTTGLAIAGLVIGIIGIVVNAIALLFLITVIVFGFASGWTG